MLIIFHVIITFLFSLFAGYGIIGFFCLGTENKKKEEIFLITPIVGYVLSQVLFYLWYILFANSLLSVFITVASLFLINLVYSFVEFKKTGSLLGAILLPVKKIDKRLLFVLAAIFILSSWQYLLIGEGHYYHSGNEDYFDGVNGGSLYVNNTPVKLIFNDLAGSVYYTAVIKFQYSSQAFWRVLLNIGGLDGFMLQQILCLFFTALGLFWLTKYVFELPDKISLWASFCGIIASFYFSTFTTGHIGSIMYVSVTPVFLGILLLWIRKKIRWQWLILSTLIYYFIDNTYPGPIYFLLIPLVLNAINERVLLPLNFWNWFSKLFGVSLNRSLKSHVKEIKLFRLALLCVILIASTLYLTYWVWNYFEPMRIDALTRTSVSWKISLYKEMVMVFWGIYPPGSVGTASILPLFVSNAIINNVSLILGIIISITVFISVFKFCISTNRRFLMLYVLLFIPYLILMRYFWGSPYYLYKFLYVHMFLVIIVLLIWLFESTVKLKKLWRKLIFSAFILLGFLNIMWNISLSLDLYVRPYHQSEKVAEFFNSISQKQFSKSYLDIPNEIHNLVFRTMFLERKINLVNVKNGAQYIIKLKNIGNSLHNSVNQTKGIFDNGLLSLEENPKENNFSLKTLYEPHYFNHININWIGNAKSIQYLILNNYISETINYITINKIENETFLDIADPIIYYLFYDKLLKRNIKINSDPAKASLFIRMKSQQTGPQFIRKSVYSFYLPVDGEFVKWNNSFFGVFYVPKGSRILDKESFEPMQFTPLINYIYEHGKKVFLDMPHHEKLYLYLKNTFEKLGVFVCENSGNSDLVIRFVLYPPYDQYTFRTVTNSNEELIGRARNTQNFSTVYWDVELVKIPFERRSYVQAKAKTTIPFRILTSIDENDMTITISNMTKDAKFLRILLSPGPSIDFSDFNLKISDNSGIMKKFHVSSPQTLLDLPLDEFKKENGTVKLNFEGENLVGKSLLPLEERFLNYMMLGAELTTSVDDYSPYMKKIFNHRALSAKMNYLSRYIDVPEPMDIVFDSDTNRCSLGLGWYPLENSDGHPMRWVGDKPAEIILGKNSYKNKSLNVNIEPGPGCGGKPLILKAFLHGRFINKYVINRKETIKIPLQDVINSDSPKQHILKLISETENKKISDDPRILNYRIFEISFKEGERKEIIDEKLDKVITLTNGWYPFETYDSNNFRWVGENAAEIVIKKNQFTGKNLYLDLEPGPGCNGKPLKLDIYINNYLFKSYAVKSRKKLTLQIAEQLSNVKQENVTLRLVPHSVRAKVSSDPRILNFRVFKISTH